MEIARQLLQFSVRRFELAKLERVKYLDKELPLTVDL